MNDFGEGIVRLSIGGMRIVTRFLNSQHMDSRVISQKPGFKGLSVELYFASLHRLYIYRVECGSETRFLCREDRGDRGN